MKHTEVISYVNRLIIDLKLELAGVEHDPITPERLAEWAEHRADLELCTEQFRIKYLTLEEYYENDEARRKAHQGGDYSQPTRMR